MPSAAATTDSKLRTNPNTFGNCCVVAVITSTYVAVSENKTQRDESFACWQIGQRQPFNVLRLR